MTTHAVILPTETSLCDIHPIKDIRSGWIFTEEGMKLNKGQQYSLFKNTVTCKKCLEIGKNLVEVNCSCYNDD